MVDGASAVSRQLALHGAWVAAAGEFPARFALWGHWEQSEPGAEPVGTARLQATLALAVGAAGTAHVAEAQPWPLVVRWERPPPPGPLPALCFAAAEAAGVLLALGRRPPPDVLLADDLRCWIAAARFGLDLLRRQRFVPAVERGQGWGEGRAYVARWRPLFDEEGDRSRLDALTWALPASAAALAWDAATAGTAAARPAVALRDFLHALVDGSARAALPAPAALVGNAPGASTPMARAWLSALSGNPTLHGNSEDLAQLAQQSQAWLSPPASRVGEPAGLGSFRVCFRLEPPPVAPRPPVLPAPPTAAPGVTAATETAPPANPWTLRYLLQATDDPSLLLPAALVWQETGATLRLLNRALDNPQEHLLRALGRAAKVFPPIVASLTEPRPERCALTAEQAYAFIRDAAAGLEAMGCGVLVPAVQTGLGLRGRLQPAKGDDASPHSRYGILNQETLVRYDWRLALGGQELTREEFEALARLKEPLVQVRGRWVELRPDDVARALDFFRRQPQSGEVGLAEALRLALAPDAYGSQGVEDSEAGQDLRLEVSAAGWLDDVLRQLQEHGRREAQTVDDPPGFVGQLRPYQKTGVAWLAALRRHGLGACLADDMGLGKTPTLIALLLHQQRLDLAGAAAPTLLICPTSVVGNWRREIARFAPSLRVLVHHGAGRNRAGFAAAAHQHDVVISTYALLHRDAAALRSVHWGDVVLDEAQNIKNASTRAAQAARSLHAQWRAALTGTPVENRLSDLWSIFQFLNPGYLGPAEAFRRRYATPIERTASTAGAASSAGSPARPNAATAHLKALVAPFILRRVKTDPKVIRDLPEKNEMRVYCPLTREQATLYAAVVRDSLREIAAAAAMQRRGRILAALTKLKQVCDHPALFLHDRSALEGRSGKLTRLCEMLEEVEAVGERALIFTQYAEMGTLLKEHLEDGFGREVLFLHGAVPAAQRDRMVARFQSPDVSDAAPRLFVLSVKAGGTGLNLTAANHVFHFDRWWNPAVENQATDRAFRIGQRREVQVHKFVCAGTFEEVLDQLIARKIAVAEAVVGTGETWITELSVEALRDLFALRPDALEGVDAGPAASKTRK